MMFQNVEYCKCSNDTRVVPLKASEVSASLNNRLNTRGYVKVGRDI